MEQEHSTSHDKQEEFLRVNRAIASHDRREIALIYEKYIAYFCGFMRKRYAFLTEEELHSIYNESLAFVFEWSKRGKLQFYGADIKTFLLNVGIKRAISYMKKFKDDGYTESIDELKNLPADVEKEKALHSIDSRLIRSIVNGMKAPCDVILSLTFVDAPLKDIAEALGRTVDATKTKRSNCIKQIRQKLEQLKIRKEDLYGG
ncbi:RNA polymerase sigma factor [Bacteroides sp. 224]|uniref:RNA polymerase sigma factor n=1 Tax=Bacteroides sp. 224 TaxID=2302936 RepID=UPI0013D50A8A|nr:sigma-70 family RNA polymerase sigma factor [Bacteroides sp. 224]NDV65370.1 sigma-70 family RNA polymerase sigma factor [Bacteroides sp. 224]